jgi:hypothetical protein
MQSRQVCPGELVQHFVALLGEHDPDQPSIVRVGRPDHHASGLGPVDELDGAVRLEQQITRDITDRGGYPSPVALDGDEQLVLHVSQTGSLRLIFTPALETAKRDAKRKQLLEILMAWQGRLPFWPEGGGKPPLDPDR